MELARDYDAVCDDLRDVVDVNFALIIDYNDKIFGDSRVNGMTVMSLYVIAICNDKNLLFCHNDWGFLVWLECKDSGIVS